MSLNATMMAAAAAAPLEHAETHERVAMAMAETAPVEAHASLNDAISRARSLNIPWSKIMAALLIAAAGGFTPQAIAAAIASLFGTQVPPAA